MKDRAYEVPIRALSDRVLQKDQAVNTPTETTKPSRIKLSQLPRGSSAVISGSDLDDADASLLLAMGLGPDAEVRMCRMGEPCIVSLPCGCDMSGCRIGLAKKIAERVYVREISA